MNSEERRWRFLNLAYDYQSEHPGEAPGITDLLGEVPDEREGELWRQTVRALDNEGLVTSFEAMGAGGSGAMLTDYGRSAVEQRRAKFASPAFQRLAAINGLLHWLYESDPVGSEWLSVDDFIESEDHVIDGQSLREQVVRRATSSLVDQGLAKGGSDSAELTGFLTLQITELGQQCVESGKTVDDFMAERRGVQPGHTFNIGTVNGSMAVDAENFTQNSTVYTGSPSEDLKILLQALSEALPVLGLSEEQAASAARDLQSLEAEADRPSPDHGFIKRRLMETVDTIVGVGNQALGLVLLGMAKKWANDMGLPVGDGG